jgi:hypothetical protein
MYSFEWHDWLLLWGKQESNKDFNHYRRCLDRDSNRVNIRLHSVTWQKTVFFNVIAVRTSNFIFSSCPLLPLRFILRGPSDEAQTPLSYHRLNVLSVVSLVFHTHIALQVSNLMLFLATCIRHSIYITSPYFFIPLHSNLCVCVELLT